MAAEEGVLGAVVIGLEVMFCEGLSQRFSSLDGKMGRKE